MNKSLRYGFTFVEMLVVVSVMTVLVALLLPAIQSCREAARRSRCSHNMGQLILAVHNYEMAHGFYPTGTINSTRPIINQAKGYHHNWIMQILPHIEQQGVWNQIDLDVGVYHPNHATIRGLTIEILQCPSENGRSPSSNYAGVHHDLEAPIDVDNNGVFILNERISFESVTSGTSNTIFIGEKLTDLDDLGWMSGTRATLRNTGTLLNLTLPGRLIAAQQPNKVPSAVVTPRELTKDIPEGALPIGGFASRHRGGANFALGDGSVRFIPDSITPAVLQQLANRRSGEEFSNWLNR